MIVRITFKTKKEEYKMLFGNSYKKWHVQMIDYIGRYFCSRERGWNLEQMLGHIIKVEVSDAKWCGWGGLKWACDKNFQKELNREGTQDGEPDNPSPRKYSNMIFEKRFISYAEKYIKKEFKFN